jgi:branched-chain amino acid transport system ATP-binding protein
LATSLLSLDRVNAYYGDSHVLHDVSLELHHGRLLALLGRNGAGKTTCISTAGIGLVPQGRRIFGSLSVKENLDVAARPPATCSTRSWRRDDVFALFPRLRERSNQLAGSLSGGEQQMLAIGRALMTNPRVLLLDEPSEGLAPQIVHEVGQVLASLKGQIAMVLVEQNLGLALALADDVVLLNTGRVVFSGSSDEFRQQQAALQSHLGVQ